MSKKSALVAGSHVGGGRVGEGINLSGSLVVGATFSFVKLQ
jgi:hypothetical protein